MLKFLPTIGVELDPKVGGGGGSEFAQDPKPTGVHRRAGALGLLGRSGEEGSKLGLKEFVLNRQGVPFGERDRERARDDRGGAKEDDPDRLEAFFGTKDGKEIGRGEVFGEDEGGREGLFEEIEEMGRLNKEAGRPTDLFKGGADLLGARRIRVEYPDLARSRRRRPMGRRRVGAAKKKAALGPRFEVAERRFKVCVLLDDPGDLTVFDVDRGGLFGGIEEEESILLGLECAVEDALEDAGFELSQE